MMNGRRHESLRSRRGSRRGGLESANAEAPPVIEDKESTKSSPRTRSNKQRNSPTIGASTRSHSFPFNQTHSTTRSKSLKSLDLDKTVSAYDIQERRRIVSQRNLKGFRLFCYRFFNDPDTLPAKAWGFFNIVAVLGAIALELARTFPELDPELGIDLLDPWDNILDVIFAAFFVIDLAGSFYGSLDRKKFFKKLSNIIDAVTTVIFIVTMLMWDNNSVFNILRFLRAFRVLALMRLVSYSPSVTIGLRAVRRSLGALAAFAVYVLVAMMFFGVLMYYIERGTYQVPEGQTRAEGEWWRANGEISPFQNAPEAFYWSITTLTTTGYGDVTPVTDLGRALAALAMCVGLLVITLPVSIIGSNYSSEWAEAERVKNMQRIRDARRLARESVSPTEEKQPEPTDVKGSRQVQNPGRTKAQRIDLLHREMDVLVMAVQEVQDRLNDINPPNYYLQVKVLLSRVAELERRNQRLTSKLKLSKQKAKEKDKQLSILLHSTCDESVDTTPYESIRQSRKFKSEGSVNPSHSQSRHSSHFRTKLRVRSKWPSKNSFKPPRSDLNGDDSCDTDDFGSSEYSDSVPVSASTQQRRVRSPLGSAPITFGSDHDHHSSSVHDASSGAASTTASDSPQWPRRRAHTSASFQAHQPAWSISPQLRRAVSASIHERIETPAGVQTDSQSPHVFAEFVEPSSRERNRGLLRSIMERFRGKRPNGASVV